MSEANIRHSLGQAGMRYKGAYNAATEYKFMNAVTHANALYILISTTPRTGITPGTDPLIWEQMMVSATTVEMLAAQAAQAAAETAQTGAEDARDQAIAAKGAAETAQGLAETAQGASETAQGAAENARDAAVTAKNAAEAAAAAAQNSACPYDVGDILTTHNAASPAVRWPGTVWAAIGAGRVLVGVNPADPDFDAPGKTGGSKTHDHDYVHSVGLSGNNGYVIDPKTLHTRPGAVASTNTARIYGPISKFGDSINVEQYVSKTSSASVLPPYETVYRYKRTA